MSRSDGSAAGFLGMMVVVFALLIGVVQASDAVEAASWYAPGNEAFATVVGVLFVLAALLSLAVVVVTDA